MLAVVSCTYCCGIPPVTKVPRGDPGGSGFTFADCFLRLSAMGV